MLPFLKPRKQSASTSVSTRSADGQETSRQEAGEHPPELMGHAEDLISAIRSGDANQVAYVMKSLHAHFSAKGADDSTEL